MTSITLQDRKDTFVFNQRPDFYIADEEARYPLMVDDRRRARAIRKSHALVIAGFAIVLALGAILGVLNSYATGIEVSTWKMEREIRHLDERIMEMRGTLYTKYNDILRDSPLADTNRNNNGYFVKDNLEVGG